MGAEPRGGVRAGPDVTGPVAPERVRGRPQPIRAARVALMFLRLGVVNELQYRVNFFVNLLQSLLKLGTGLAVLALVYGHVNQLNGWSEPQLLAVLGVQILMGGVILSVIQPNMARLIEDIRQGKLDFALTKPEDAQLLVSVRQVGIWQAIDLAIGGIVVGVAVSKIQSGVGILDALAFLGALLLGGILIYCFWLIITTGAFWLVRMDQVVELFEGVYQTGRWPVTIYPTWMRFGLTFLVPIAFAVTVPAEAITSRLTVEVFLLAAAFTVFLLGFTRWFWKRGLRRYSGASA